MCDCIDTIDVRVTVSLTFNTRVAVKGHLPPDHPDFGETVLDKSAIKVALEAAERIVNGDDPEIEYDVPRPIRSAWVRARELLEKAGAR